MMSEMMKCTSGIEKHSLALRLWFVQMAISFTQLKLSRSQLFHFKSKSIIVPYETTWRKVNSMSISNGGNLFISHRQGMSKIDLETCRSRLVVALDDQLCILQRFATEILYPNQKKAPL